nr:MAG TPA_asm: hypothetical protein [Caudoviricetes sp.]
MPKSLAQPCMCTSQIKKAAGWQPDGLVMGAIRRKRT